MKLLGFIWLTGLFTIAMVHRAQCYPADSLLFYFKQVEDATFRYQSLWDKDIYGPVLLVDPETREVYANRVDAEGILNCMNGIYTGILPLEVTISNTDIQWNGTHWAMIKLPLSANAYDRIDLITHELFHVAQPSLGFQIRREENKHLDIREGRIYLRLEMAALKAALKAQRFNRAEEHLRNALIFRKYRQMLYRGSETTENSLELLEGLASYTGQIMSGRDKWQWREYLVSRIDIFEKVPSFVRSFAYETIPVYGFFLYQKDNHWNKGMNADTQLTEFLSEAFGVDRRILLQSYVKQVAEEYNGRIIIDEENKRELTQNTLIDFYREKFFERPHLEIRLEDMNMSFDLQKLVPLDEDEGTVYPSITLSDKWGILTVKRGGALLRDDWRWVIVSEPLTISEKEITGEGWTIALNEGYQVIQNSQGNYHISKKNTTQLPEDGKFVPEEKSE
ncbi:hypothetical protein [Proteiniphilum sp. UBA5384]|uniref:hypothetical protein n=1 Tax=Proteiniphilum sp. UBA5384 TaxID=1947279 RepID=UPI0025E42BB8|nr:hypothetical protein [Proteiniphilum sp. UBA5384]